MPGTGKTRLTKRKRSWLITLGVSLIAQLIFLAVDGTPLEPRLNDLGNIAGRILENKLFTKWITPYSFPFFNMFTAICIIYLLGKAVKDIYSYTFSRDQIN